MKSPSLKKSLFAVFLIVATELIGFGLIIPILPQIALQFNVSGLWMGILLSSYSLAQFLASPILGAASDKWGRKKILILSKLGTAFSYLVLASAGSYPLFLIARLIDGFTGGNIAVARAYISDITTPENRASGMAIIGMSFGVGFILGPALGGFLFGTFDSHTIPALVAASLSIIATLFTILFIQEPEKKRSQHHNIFNLNPFQYLKQSSIAIILATQLIFMVCFAGFETTLSVFTFQNYHFSHQQNSQIFLYFGILAFIIQGSIARKSFKNLKFASILAMALTGIAFVILGTSPSKTEMYISLVFLSLGIAILNTHLPALLSTSTNPDETGKIMGLYESIGSLGRIVGPLLLFTTFFGNITKAYLFCSTAILVGIILLASGRFRREGH